MNDKWRRVVVMAIGVGGLLFMGVPGFAAEHGGKEHVGSATREGSGTAAPQAKEHGGTTHEHGGQAVKVEPSAAQIRQTIESYVKDIEAEQGVFEIEDELTGATRRLTFVRVHERVGKTGDLYYSCTDMRDTATGELLDLDFDVDATDGQLNIVDTRLHKVAGEARYTYDDKGNRIPLPPPGRERAY